MIWRRFPSNERGAMLVQVALSILTLTAFTVFVVDYGVVWVARGQAQNAADSGALAGAVARGLDDTAHPPATSLPRLAAAGAAAANVVWGEEPVVGEPIFSWGGQPCPPGIGGRCARVDVFRNAENNNPLPVIFGRLLGIEEQGVRATATARTAVATTTNCLKPWGVADKWIEWRDGDQARSAPAHWTPAENYDRWAIQGNKYTAYENPIDVYTRPSTTSTGTGFTPAQDLGLQLVLSPGQDDGNNTEFPGGFFVKLDLPCEKGGGGACYKYNIPGCNGIPYSIGDVLQVDNTPGSKIGPTDDGIQELLKKDPGAHWVKDPPGGPWVPGQPLPGKVAGSQYATSPRVVPIGLIDIDDYLSTGPNGKTEVTLANIIGYFVEGTCSSLKGTGKLEAYSQAACDKTKGNQDKAAIVGRLMPMPGLLISTAPAPISEESSFLSVIQLVR
jgi:hypothetical protein